MIFTKETIISTELIEGSPDPQTTIYQTCQVVANSTSDLIINKWTPGMEIHIVTLLEFRKGGADE